MTRDRKSFHILRVRKELKDDSLLLFALTSLKGKNTRQSFHFLRVRK